MKLKKIDNFKIWRESMKKRGLIKSQYPNLKHNENTAELIGLILGDGNLYQFPRTEQLVISFNSTYPRIITRAKHLINDIFNKKPKENKVNNAKCVRLCIYEKYLSKRLQIPVGAKKNHYLQFPRWIWNNEKWVVGCLIGLYNAEGSYSIHLPTCTYNFQFSNYNKGLLEDTYKAITQLGFHAHLRNITVTVRRRDETKKLSQLLKFEYYRQKNCGME